MSDDRPELRILHVDMDAFYASVEQRDRKELRGKPVIVGGDPHGRGVVAAASYEARRFGVRSAMPSAQAHRLCPEGIFVPPDFERYAEASRRIMEILRSFTPVVEPLSLDEAFLDLKGTERLFGDAIACGKSIQQRILDEVRLPSSVGIGTSKFIAKVASDARKPRGFCVVQPGEEARFLAPMKVETIFGIGPRTAERLHRIGIHTVADLASRPQEELERTMGAHLLYVHDLAQGRDPRPVRSERSDHSHGKERTFAEDLHRAEDVRRFLLSCAHEVGFELQEQGLVGKTLTLKVRYSNFRTLTRSHTFERPTNRGARLFQKALELWRQVPNEPVRLLGISMHGLRSELEMASQGTLFPDLDDSPDDRRERLEQSWLEIRRKFGKDALMPSSLLDGKGGLDRSKSLRDAERERDRNARGSHES